MESLDASARVDESSRLLALTVMRLVEAADGSVCVTRDSNFSGPLTVEFRFVPARISPYMFVPTQTITIAAGEASAPLAIRGKVGDVLTLRAGNGYTPTPAEQSNKIQFAD